MEFACWPCVSVASLQVLQLPPTVQRLGLQTLRARSTKLLSGFYARKSVYVAPTTVHPIHRVDVNVNSGRKCAEALVAAGRAEPDSFEYI